MYASLDGEVQMSCNALRQPDFPVDRECVGETRFHRLMAEFIPDSPD